MKTDIVLLETGLVSLEVYVVMCMALLSQNLYFLTDIELLGFDGRKKETIHSVIPVSVS